MNFRKFQTVLIVIFGHPKEKNSDKRQLQVNVYQIYLFIKFYFNFESDTGRNV